MTPHPTRYISRYPVTNAQYQAFIEAGGYESDKWWENLNRPEPEKPQWNHANRPRTDINWYEAVAYSRWLSAMRNLPIRLATEAEWEKAARGNKGQGYPWGEEYINGYANVNESSVGGKPLEQTTTVGLYPQGASPYGAMDMAGNVWEWCLNKFDHPDQVGADASGNTRVLRGGSWIVDPLAARADYRYSNRPANRFYRWGFRLLLPAPISGR
ncbi:MAG: SUMF1/EgtB/PvdO family nonheme iron enzyme [Gammaproteobacteria bacterium]|nr:SUMF1/EgtB/PvdO family nonheme iron enzyme [Gammaproteobacteria bacterium]